MRLGSVLTEPTFPSQKTLLRRPILLYAIVGAALTMPYVTKVSRARIESLRPINLMISRPQLPF